MFPLRDSTHLNYLSQNVTFSHLLFGRVSSGRKRRHKQIARLRNKCAMTDYGHAELVSVSCGLNPSPAFQAPSAQGRQGHTHRTALRFPLSPQVARENILGYMRKIPYNSMKYEPILSQRATCVKLHTKV